MSLLRYVLPDDDKYQYYHHRVLIFTSQKGIIMKTLGRISFLLVLTLALVGSLQAQSLFSEDFTGLTAGNLAGQSSWTKGGSGPDATVANATPLTRSGYNGGGAEYVVMPAPSATSSRVYKTFTTPATNFSGTTFYFSLLLNLTSTSTTATNYFISLGGSGTSTSYGAKLFARTSGSGYNIGLSKTSNTAVFGSSVLNLNSTYLIVVKYTFNLAGTAAPNNLDDVAYLWVNPSGSEPSTATAECTVPAGGSDTDYDGFAPTPPTDVGNFIWHNRGLGNPTGSFDGIRVGNGATSAAAWSNLNIGTPTDVETGPETVPLQFSLSQNYPNPFNPSTMIRYELPKASTVTLQIFNTLGQHVATLVEGAKEAGAHQVRWSANAPSGMYFYMLSAGDFVGTKKMVLAK